MQSIINEEALCWKCHSAAGGWLIGWEVCRKRNYKMVKQETAKTCGSFRLDNCLIPLKVPC